MKPEPKTPSQAIRERQGAKLRQYRKHRPNPKTGTLGIPQSDVAAALGVTKAAVSEWESGKSSPRPHHQIAIAKFYGAPWSVLFGLDGEAAA